MVVVAGGDSHTVISPLKSKKNKNKNIPGAQDAPSLVIVVMADGCYGGAGAGAGAGAATAVAGTGAATIAACRGGCGHVLCWWCW